MNTMNTTAEMTTDDATAVDYGAPFRIFGGGQLTEEMLFGGTPRPDERLFAADGTYLDTYADDGYVAPVAAVEATKPPKKPFVASWKNGARV